MRLEIKVIPGARKSVLTKEGGQWKIHLQTPAVEGKANKALIDFLAEHFQVRKSQIQIIKGLKSRQKTISIEGI